MILCNAVHIIVVIMVNLTLFYFIIILCTFIDGSGPEEAILKWSGHATLDLIPTYVYIRTYTYYPLVNHALTICMQYESTLS